MRISRNLVSALKSGGLLLFALHSDGSWAGRSCSGLSGFEELSCACSVQAFDNAADYDQLLKNRQAENGLLLARQATVNVLVQSLSVAILEKNLAIVTEFQPLEARPAFNAITSPPQYGVFDKTPGLCQEPARNKIKSTRASFQDISTKREALLKSLDQSEQTYAELLASVKFNPAN